MVRKQVSFQMISYKTTLRHIAVDILYNLCKQDAVSKDRQESVFGSLY